MRPAFCRSCCRGPSCMGPTPTAAGLHGAHTYCCGHLVECPLSHTCVWGGAGASFSLCCPHVTAIARVSPEASGLWPSAQHHRPRPAQTSPTWQLQPTMAATAQPSPPWPLQPTQSSQPWPLLPKQLRHPKRGGYSSALLQPPSRWGAKAGCSRPGHPAESRGGLLRL